MATRRFLDCREHPDSQNKCTIAISADTDEELIDVAVQHAVSKHGMQDSPELRTEIKKMIKVGSLV